MLGGIWKNIRILVGYYTAQRSLVLVTLRMKRLLLGPVNQCLETLRSQNFDITKTLSSSFGRRCMEVTIKYTDDHSLTVEEVVRQATHNYGKYVEVSVMPDSTKAHDLIYFGLQSIITHQQLSMWYDDKHTYPKSLQTLRAQTLYKVQEILDQLIIDNEAKIT